MTEDVDDLDEGQEKDGEQETSSTKNKEFQEQLDALVEEKLSSIKEKLDKAYQARDAEKKAKEKAEKELEATRRKKLEDEGKFTEAIQAELDTVKAERDALREELNSYTRDQEIEKALDKQGVEFRNGLSKEIAIKEIRATLTKDDDGTWIHKSGASISDYVKTFVKNPEIIDTLLKPKDNTGAGTSTSKGGSTAKPTSLSKLNSEQLLELARSGKLGDAFSY